MPGVTIDEKIEIFSRFVKTGEVLTGQTYKTLKKFL